MKKNRLLLLLLVCALVLSSCTFPVGKSGGKKQEVKENENGELNIYYPSELQVAKRDTTYRLRTPDSLTTSVEELMTELMAACDNEFTAYTYMLDEKNNLQLTIRVASEIGSEQKLLLTASILETLFQLDEIETVSMQMTNEAGDVLSEELFTRSSVYYYDNDSEDYGRYNPRTVTVYEATEDGAYLKGKPVRIYPTPDESMEELLIDHLAATGTIPRSTKVNSVSQTRDTLNLDLSDDFLSEVSGHTPETVVYSIVNSVYTLSDSVSYVRITVDGETVSTFHDTVVLSEPLVFNSAILKEE